MPGKPCHFSNFAAVGPSLAQASLHSVHFCRGRYIDPSSLKMASVALILSACYDVPNLQLSAALQTTTLHFIRWCDNCADRHYSPQQKNRRWAQFG